MEAYKYLSEVTRASIRIPNYFIILFTLQIYSPKIITYLQDRNIMEIDTRC